MNNDRPPTAFELYTLSTPVTIVLQYTALPVTYNAWVKSPTDDFDNCTGAGNTILDAIHDLLSQLEAAASRLINT